MSRDGDACARTGCNLSRRQHEDVGEIDHEFTPPESRSVQGEEVTVNFAKLSPNLSKLPDLIDRRPRYMPLDDMCLADEGVRR